MSPRFPFFLLCEFFCLLVLRCEVSHPFPLGCLECSDRNSIFFRFSFILVCILSVLFYNVSDLVISTIEISDELDFELDLDFELIGGVSSNYSRDRSLPVDELCSLMDSIRIPS